MLDLLLPRRCGVCGCTLLARERHLCTECAMKMPLTYFWLQERNPMADRFNERIEEGLTQDVLNGRQPSREQYAFATALYFYKDDYRELSKSLKYRAAVSLGRYVAQALGRKIAACSFLGDVDLVVPVPLHPLRRLKRGYNQAQVIAESIVEVLEGGKNVSLACGVLRRGRNTTSQTFIDVAHKAENVSGAFSVRMDCLPQCRHILLVDDVCTTASTLAECQRTLRGALVEKFGPEAGQAVRISAATLAFVGD